MKKKTSDPTSLEAEQIMNTVDEFGRKNALNM